MYADDSQLYRSFDFNSMNQALVELKEDIHTPHYFYDKIPFRTDIRHINNRHNGLLTVSSQKMKIFERCFRYNVSELYNGVSSRYT